MCSWSAVWAKSWPYPPQELEQWLPLHQHLDDTQGVAELLFDHWAPAPVIRRIVDDVGGEKPARALFSWLAAVHDVGKVSPAFAVQVKRLRDRMIDAGFPVDSRLSDDEVRSRVNHALVGHTAVLDWLVGRGVPAVDASRLASVVGSHHGVTPEWSRLTEVAEQTSYAGDGVWARVRDVVLARAGERCAPSFSVDRLTTPSLVLLTALVIVADWIASNPDYFPLWGFGEVGEPDEARTERRLKAGWSELDLPQRWVAPEPGEAGATFAARFGMAPEKIRDVQAGVVDAARAMRGAGLLVLEAPMGWGKTEAALLAAEVLAHDSGANGCFVALPTQATTDAMFGRVRSWLDHVPGGATLTLAHGKAHLNDEYRGLARRGRFATECGAVAHDWLRGRKKAGLASFVVGTIDQVLFAGLKSRHVMLRHLALAGKVVIIDEVHAYDVYMSRYLHRVLEWLGAYRVPVILLSATLPDARRAELLRAYDSVAVVPDAHPGYPVITATGLAARTFPLPDKSVPVVIDRLDDDLDTLSAYLREHLRDGGCAVVVRNTVGRVQETAAHLADEFDVTINHARFLACDRAANDRDLLRRFGPPDKADDRPARHVVVASQVVEQSLDIDFDLMVTDLAPIDLVLQRMGRLHRHHRPDRVVRPRCAVTGADWETAPVSPVRGSTRVYGTHHLLRAAALLTRDTVALPHDIATLVQAGYGDDPLGPPEWQPAMADARRDAEQRSRRRKDAARTYLVPPPGGGDLVGWLHAHAGEAHDDSPQGMAQVRDGAESLEVIVVQCDTDGGLRTPDWVDGGGQQIPLMGELPWQLARIISVCSLRLPFALCHAGVIDAVINELEKTKVASFQQTRVLEGQLVLALDGGRQAELHGYRLTYDITRGLLHERI
ncbi:CRISPR-associated helicase Cas3' [Actinophytocola sediminis]